MGQFGETKICKSFHIWVTFMKFEMECIFAIFGIQLVNLHKTPLDIIMYYIARYSIFYQLEIGIFCNVCVVWEQKKYANKQTDGKHSKSYSSGFIMYAINIDTEELQYKLLSNIDVYKVVH